MRTSAWVTMTETAEPGDQSTSEPAAPSGAAIGVLDQVREDFGIRFGMKRMSLALQLSSQRTIVLDDAVMYYGQYASTVGMRVGIDVVGTAMGSPACVTDTQWARFGP